MGPASADRSRRIESDGTLRWGILSTAGIATEKAIPGMLRAARCEVVAIGSRDQARAAAVAERHGIARAHGSYEALLADPAVDAVYIPLPNHLHAEWTIAAARAGKHVLCEKPLALTAADAERMIEVCRGRGRRASWRRSCTASTRRGSPSASWSPPGGSAGWRRSSSWFSYFNDDPANIRNIAAYGGGALFDIGCYSVNLSRMLFGAEPERVEAAIIRDPASGVDVLTSGLLQFAGRRGDLHLLDAGRAGPAGPRLRDRPAGSPSASPSTSRPTGRPGST